LPRRRQTDYKPPDSQQELVDSMEALYMIIAFIVVMGLLNVISTGRLD
jgi:hypothetical protein